MWPVVRVHSGAMLGPSNRVTQCSLGALAHHLASCLNPVSLCLCGLPPQPRSSLTQPEHDGLDLPVLTRAAKTHNANTNDDNMWMGELVDS